MSAIDGSGAMCGDAKKTLRASATLWSWITNYRLNIALGLESIECGVDGTDGDVALGASFDFLTDGDAVGLIAETQKSQDNDVFEFAKKIALVHYIYNIEEIEKVNGRISAAQSA